MRFKFFFILPLLIIKSDAKAQFNSERSSKIRTTYLETGGGYGAQTLNWRYSKIYNNNIRLIDANDLANFKPHCFSLSVSHGWNTRKKLFLGATIGYDNFASMGNLLPAGLDIRQYLGNRKIRPFLGFKSGYSLGLSKKETSSSFYCCGYKYREKFEGGFFINPTVGLQIQLSKKTLSKLLLKVGYSYQKIKYTEVYELFNLECNELQSLTFMAGISF